jgi:hypothetical protein
MLKENMILALLANGWLRAILQGLSHRPGGDD